MAKRAFLVLIFLIFVLFIAFGDDTDTEDLKDAPGVELTDKTTDENQQNLALPNASEILESESIIESLPSSESTELDEVLEYTEITEEIHQELDAPLERDKTEDAEAEEAVDEEVVDEIATTPIQDLLFAYSIFTATQDELKTQAEAYGITSNYKSELLKLYGITLSEEKVLDFFNSKKEKKTSDYSFKVVSADRFERTKAEDNEDDNTLTLYGNVNVQFSADGESKNLKADSMVISTDESILIAYGNISIQDAKGSKLQNITSNLLVFSWENNSIVLYDALGGMQKTSKNKIINYYMSGDAMVFDNSTSETYFKNATLATNRNTMNAAWSISAQEIMTKNTGDVFLTMMFLKVGRVPILPLPALFMPGSSLVFNPAIGFASDKGMFINTTTDIFGGFKETSKANEDESIADSFTSLFGASTDKSTIKKSGLIYKRSSEGATPLEAWASKTKSHLTLFADAYVDEGFFLGADSAFNLFSNQLAITLYGGIAYKPQRKVTTYTSTVYPSFRYGINGNLSAKFSFLTASLDFPFYSDPQFRYKYFNRITSFSFDSLFGTSQKFPTTYSSSSETTTTEKLTLSTSLPSAWRSDYLQAFTISLDASIQRVWKAPDGSRAPYSFQWGEVKLPSVTASMSGTLFNIKKGTTATEALEISYEKAKEYERELDNMSLSERLEKELLIQRARQKEIERYLSTPMEEGKVIHIDPIGKEIDDEKKKNTLPQGYSTATAVINDESARTFRTFFDESYLKMTYTINEEFSNTHLAPTERQNSVFGDQTLYNKTTGTISLDGAVNKNYLSFSQKLTPTYIYSKQESQNNLTSHEFTLAGTSTASIPILGLSWNLAMTYYKYKKTLSDTTQPVVEEANGEWNKTNITTHSLSFSKAFFNNILSLSVSGNLPPLSSSIAPTLRLSYAGFVLSGSHTMSGESITALLNKTSQGALSYSNSFMSASLNVLYDYTKEMVGMKFLRPFTITESVSFTFLNSLLKFSHNLNYQGISTSGLDNYFSAINFNASVGSYASLVMGLTGPSDNIELTTTKLTLSTGDINLSFWRGRIRLAFNFATSMNISFTDPFQNTLDYAFTFKLDIKEFLSASMALKGSNKNIYKYFGNGSGTGKFSFQDLLRDLMRSLNIFNPNDLRNTNFVLSALDIGVAHDMGDWVLSFTYTTEIVLEQNNWVWKPKYTILLQWSAIPELKVDKTINN